MKWKLIFTTLVAGTVLCSAGNVLAAPAMAASIQGNNTIPKQMQPGAIIRYNQNDQLIVVNKSSSKNELLPKNQPNVSLSQNSIGNNKARAQQIKEAMSADAQKLPHHYLGDPQLPKPQPGMQVFYDGTGNVFKVLLNGKDITPLSHTVKVTLPKTGTNEFKTSSYETEVHTLEQTLEQVGLWYYGSYADGPYGQNYLDIGNGDVYGDGQVTWYSGQPGDSGQTLQSDDCATKIDYDQPQDGTPIWCYDNNNNISATVYKEDVGSLPNAILDIRQPEMSNVFGVATGSDDGSFSGTTSHSD